MKQVMVLLWIVYWVFVVAIAVALFKQNELCGGLFVGIVLGHQINDFLDRKDQER